MKEKDWDTHINLLAWLYILGNGILLVIGFLSLIFFTGIGVATGDPTAMPILTVVGGVGALFFAVLAIPGLAAGYGLLVRAPWARVLTLVVAFLNMFNIPLGTAVGIYSFWVLLQSDIVDYFEPLKTA